jgi:GR25 family glycosyltransferase involved in LPS biosynthesis
MERSVDRKQFMQENVVDKLPNFECEFFQAIDGKNNVKVVETLVPELDIILHNANVYVANYNHRIDYNFRGKLNLQQIGANLSHISVSEQLIYDNEYDYYLILEDDSKLNCSENTIVEYLQHLPKQFDFIHLDGSDAVEFEKTTPETPENEYFYNVKKQCFNRLSAYILSKSGAAKYVSYFKHNICRPPDDSFSHLFLLTDYKVFVPKEWLFRLGDLPSTMEYK